jgi:pimeloyl-ACP methyl ester carboxylesterase
MLQQKLGERRYPGDFVRSPYWPHVAPGVWGSIDALSPKNFDTSAIVDIGDKPPVLWVHGENDKIVSDCSLFDVATLASPDPENDSANFPPQPIVAQMREFLPRYASKGGRVEVVSMKDTGHSPFLEKPQEFLHTFRMFVL